MKPNFKIFKVKTLDIFEIFQTPKAERRNARPELVSEPMLLDVSRIVLAHKQTKEDEENHGFQVSATLFPHDIVSFAEEAEDIFTVIEEQAQEEEEVGSAYCIRCNIYRDAIEDWIPAIVRIDKIPMVTPCDLPSEEYKDAEYRGTVLTFAAGAVILSDIDFDQVVKLFSPKKQISRYMQICEDVQAEEAARQARNGEIEDGKIQIEDV